MGSTSLFLGAVRVTNPKEARNFLLGHYPTDTAKSLGAAKELLARKDGDQREIVNACQLMHFVTKDVETVEII